MTLVIAAAALSSLLTSVWHELRAWAATVANCEHDYGEVITLPTRAGNRVFPPAWVRNCTKCGDTMQCNADGSLYVPPKR